MVKSTHFQHVIYTSCDISFQILQLMKNPSTPQRFWLSLLHDAVSSPYYLFPVPKYQLFRKLLLSFFCYNIKLSLFLLLKFEDEGVVSAFISHRECTIRSFVHTFFMCCNVQVQLLNWQERTLLNVPQTNLLLNKLQELSMARLRPDFIEADLPPQALSSVRLALATNLGRAILEE